MGFWWLWRTRYGLLEAKEGRVSKVYQMLARNRVELGSH